MKRVLKKGEGLVRLRHLERSEVTQVTCRQFGSQLALALALLEQAMCQGYVKAQLEKMKAAMLDK